MRAKKGQHVRRGVGTEPATIIRLCTTVVHNTAVSDGKRFRHHVLKTKYKHTANQLRVNRRLFLRGASDNALPGPASTI